MNRTAIAMVVLALLPGLAAGAATPKATVASPRFEFGTIGQGEEVRHSFVVKNDGDAPLTLTKVREFPHLRVEIGPSPIAAGRSGKVDVVFDGQAAAGPTEVEAFVGSNDPAQSTLTFVLAGTVEARLGAKPGYARWNTVQGEKEATIAQTVWAADGSSFRVLGVDAPPYVHTSVREARPEERSPNGKGPQWRVELTIDSWAPVGAITGPAVVRTDYAKQREVLIPLSGFVRPIVLVEPPSGQLGALNVAGTAKVNLRVRFFGTTPVHLTGAEVNVAGTSVTIAPIEAGRLYGLTLQFSPAVAAGPLAGKLILKTDSPKLPVYEFPLTASIEGSKVSR